MKALLNQVPRCCSYVSSPRGSLCNAGGGHGLADRADADDRDPSSITQPELKDS